MGGAQNVQKNDVTRPYSPLTMPAWEGYKSKQKINLILAYLISINNWYDEELFNYLQR